MPIEKYRKAPPTGSPEFRCEELATQNDELRIDLDAALEREMVALARDLRRCAFLRALNER